MYHKVCTNGKNCGAAVAAKGFACGYCTTKSLGTGKNRYPLSHSSFGGKFPPFHPKTNKNSKIFP
ncbi:MAG: hypothetical protein DBY34_05500 [Oscillospiraceae bacterium]|nr:MAG: hypothetical protein DBY34_05500 [Oscillospiraceae bacterium]